MKPQINESRPERQYADNHAETIIMGMLFHPAYFTKLHMEERPDRSPRMPFCSDLVKMVSWNILAYNFVNSIIN